MMYPPVNPELLVEELYAKYGCAVTLDYAINYIDMNEDATVDDFYYWLQSFGAV